MLRTDLLLGDFESAVSVHRRADGELLRMSGEASGAALVYVPDDDARGRRELEMAAKVRFAGVPECSRTIDSPTGSTALIFDGAQDARPLALIHDLPAPTLRAGLVALLTALRFAHSRGIVHGRIDRANVLADPQGRFWLMGWADARDVARGVPVAGALSEAATDLRDLARAFREALLRRPWPDPDADKVHERDPRTAAGLDLIDAGVRIDRDFARVVSRLVTADPRDAYSGATEVLADIGGADTNAFDPWEALPPIGLRREVARVMRLLDDTRLAASETVTHAASIEFLGPDGAGKTRILAEIARVGRTRDAIVLTAAGGAVGPWGGLGTLARQLVQLLGRGARMCVQHEEALRHLLVEHDDAPRPHSSPLLDGSNPLISACTAAFTDLVRIAFRRAPGLLLMDDEDQLPSAARQIWRSAGQFVQAINGEGGVLQVLLVAASAGPAAPAEIGATRIVVELRPWRPRDLEKFLARAFGVPAGAREVGLTIHRITGGRPGDVVGYLRELERREMLRREGLRWRLLAPLSSLPPLAGGMAEQVRRALESCSRDAVTLVELLAVAHDVALPREVIAEICDLRGPRLAAAGDAASAAGLVETTGATWRIRSAAARHKVIVSTAADAARIMHHEVLEHLLALEAVNADSIAVHARSAGDPCARTWTDLAITQAIARGALTRALSHLDDGGPEISETDDASKLTRAHILMELGRIGDVIRIASNRNDESVPSVLAFILIATRASYEARDWSSVLAFPLNEEHASSQHLAEMRYLRAASMCNTGKWANAEREARLARAESDAEECSTVTIARLEWEYQRAFFSKDILGARKALLERIRRARQTGNTRESIVARTKLGNALRYISGDDLRARRSLMKAVLICRRNPEVGGSIKSALHCALGYLCWDTNHRRRGYRHFSASVFHAIQSGAATLATAARVRAITWGLSCGVVTYADKQYIIKVVDAATDAADVAAASVSVDVALCLLYYGLQEKLECFTSTSTVLQRPSASVLRGMCMVGRIWFTGDMELPVSLTGEAAAPRRALRDLYRTRIGDLWLSAVPSCLRYLLPGRTGLSERLVDRGIGRLTSSCAFPGWGVAALALGLALWVPISYDVQRWVALRLIVHRYSAPLPVPLEWQRVLMESRELRRLGDWRSAEVQFRRAESQLKILLNGEFGQIGASAYQYWATRLASERRQYGELSSRTTNATAREQKMRLAVPQHWQELLTASMAHDRLRILSPLTRELEEFATSLSARLVGSIVIRASSVKALDCLSSKTLLLLTPDLWPKHATVHLAATVARLGNCVRVFTLVTRSASTARLQANQDTEELELPPLLQYPSDRSERFASLLNLASPRTSISREADGRIRQYHWPGGLQEVELVVNSVASLSLHEVSDEILGAVMGNWRAFPQLIRGNDLSSAVLIAVEQRRLVSSPELVRVTGIPARTLQRTLSQLVADRQIERLGRGRATQYKSLEMR